MGVIYSITNIVNNKVYVGSTIDFPRRIKDHLKTLKNNKHDNPYLQNAWNKYGIDNFEFKVMEEVLDEQQLIEREQFFMDYFMSYYGNNGYNIRFIADSNLGVVWSEASKKKMSALCKGRKISETTKKKLSESLKGEKNHFYGKHHTENTKEKISEANKGKTRTLENKLHLSRLNQGENNPFYGKCHTKESKKNIADKASKVWVITTPDGKEIFVKSLCNVCEKNDLSPDCMRKVARGKQSTHKKWQCRYATEEEVNTNAKL